MKAHESHLPTFFLPKRKAVKKQKGLKRGPVRKVSSKRKAALKVYSELRKAFLAERPYCEVSVCEYLKKHGGVEFESRGVWRATDVHHKFKRHGERLNDTSQWMAVSREGHEWIHAHPKESRERGWLI